MKSSKYRVHVAVIFFIAVFTTVAQQGNNWVDGELHTFKLGAFHMARDLALPILPVTIRGTEAILPPDGIELRPGKAEMIIHPPIGEAQVHSMSAEALRDMTREIIAAPLGRKP